MDKLELYSGGFPLTTKTLEHLQNAYSNAIEALTTMGGNTFILKGTVVTGTAVSDGAIVYNGEYLPFVGGPYSDTVSIYETVENVTYNTDANTDGNLDRKRAYIKRYAACGTDGLETFAFSALKPIKDLVRLSLNATTESEGLVELATNTEVLAGTDTQRAVTPAALESKTATETRKGLVELATDTEVLTGTDTQRAVTPAALESKTATTARRGLIEIATQTEVNAGTDNTRAVTPSTLKNYNFQSIKVTTGMLTTTNRKSSVNAIEMFNDFTNNVAYVYPPSGFDIYDLQGIIASIASVDFSGDVNEDDSMYCRHRIERSNNRVAIIAQNTENRAASRINYLAIWQK